MTDAAASHRSPAVAEPVYGSYFVSTYPPFFYWSEGATAAFSRALAAPPSGVDSPPLGVYLHIPFCVRRCRYCYYLSYEDRPEEMEPYVGGLMRELTAYLETSALVGRTVHFVYFGGGTPSILAAAQIRKLLDWLRRMVPLADAAEITFECAPRTLTARKAEVLRDGGVNRLSLGVQQLDDEVLERNGRIHLVVDAEKAWTQARGAGFPQINVDLMVGMLGETTASFRRSLDRVLDWGPESITIYQMEIPFNTPLYRAAQAGWHPPEPPSWPQKRERLAGGLQRLEEAGYTLRSAYAAVRDPDRHRFVYQDAQYRGAELLGLGASAFSYIGGVHQQNLASLDAYQEAVRDHRLPLWRAHVLSPEERLIREFILQLKLGAVPRGPFRERHGVDPVERFAPRLVAHAQRGWLVIDDDAVRMTRPGLLRVDRLLRSFFLPQHRGPWSS